MATIAITKGYNDPSGFTSGETVTPAKLNSAQSPTAAITFATADDTDNSTLEVSGGKFRVKDGGVTLAKLVTAVQQALLPAGAVQAFAMNSVPAGWLAANGNEYAKTGDYAALFAAISTTYGETNGSGGAGTSHFRVPDLRGYFVRGVGVAGQNGANSDGTVSGAFGAKQADDLKSHTHGYTDQIAVSNGQFNVAGGTGQDGASDLARTTGSTGGAETRPKNIAMLYCIKF
jgi:microcystin-dependent protein